MSFSLTTLNWDSNHFGYKVGQVIHNDKDTPLEINQLLKAAAAQNFKLLYYKVNSKELLQPLENTPQVILADKKVTFLQSLDSSYKFDPGPDFEIFKDNVPNKKLIDLSLQSGIFSRFAIDPNFKNNEFEKLYTEWIRKSVSGDIAKEVWTSLDDSGAINGLITLGIKNNIADIGLLAIDESSRGKNIGSQLINISKARTLAWGLNQLQVVTQLDNTGACNFYKRNGFEINDIEYIYHIWIE